MGYKHTETTKAISAIKHAFSEANLVAEKIDHYKHRYSDQIARTMTDNAMEEFRSVIAAKDTAIRALEKAAPAMIQEAANAELIEDAKAPALALFSSGAILQPSELLAVAHQNAGNALVLRAVKRYAEQQNMMEGPNGTAIKTATLNAEAVDRVADAQKAAAQLVDYMRSYSPNDRHPNSTDDLKHAQYMWGKIEEEGILENLDNAW